MFDWHASYNGVNQSRVSTSFVERKGVCQLSSKQKGLLLGTELHLVRML